MLTIIVRGGPSTGKTTTANLIKLFLEENGYKDVAVADIAPMPQEKKRPFRERLERTRAMPVRIRVELAAAPAEAPKPPPAIQPTDAPPDEAARRHAGRMACMARNSHEFEDGICARCGGAEVGPPGGR